MAAVATPRDRRTGLCPTFSTPSAQRDGLLFRVPLVGGRLTGEHIEALAEVAERHGNGIVELTNRGNVQIRGVQAADVAQVVHRFAELGLGHEMARIVTISPYAGRAPTSLREALVTDLLERDLAGLSGKFVVHVDDTDVSATTADVALVIVDGQHVCVRVGSAATTMSVPEAIERVVQIIEACIAHGPDARRKDVIADDRSAGNPVGSPDTPHDSASHDSASLGIVLLADGRLAAVAAVPLGRTDPTQLRAIGAAAARHGLGEVHVTAQRSVMVPCATRTDAEAVVAATSDAGLIVTEQHPALGVVTCIGRQGCWQTELDTLAAAATVIEAREQLDGARRIHVSGCAKSCACHDPVDVTLLGREDSSGFDTVRRALSLGATR